MFSAREFVVIDPFAGSCQHALLDLASRLQRPRYWGLSSIALPGHGLQRIELNPIPRALRVTQDPIGVLHDPRNDPMTTTRVAETSGRDAGDIAQCDAQGVTGAPPQGPA